jgi:hypothetical protein
MDNENLWPAKFEVPDIELPVTILKRQAANLSTLTKGLLEGKLEGTKGIEDNFGYTFYIIAPALGNYRYRFFEVRYGISLYPINIRTSGETWVKLETPGKFKEHLRKIFGSPETLKIVGALLKQSTSN